MNNTVLVPQLSKHHRDIVIIGAATVRDWDRGVYQRRGEEFLGFITAEREINRGREIVPGIHGYRYCILPLTLAEARSATDDQ